MIIPSTDPPSLPGALLYPFAVLVVCIICSYYVGFRAMGLKSLIPFRRKQINMIYREGIRTRGWPKWPFYTALAYLPLLIVYFFWWIYWMFHWGIAWLKAQPS